MLTEKENRMVEAMVCSGHAWSLEMERMHLTPKPNFALASNQSNAELRSAKLEYRRCVHCGLHCLKLGGQWINIGWPYSDS